MNYSNSRIIIITFRFGKSVQGYGGFEIIFYVIRNNFCHRSGRETGQHGITSNVVSNSKTKQYNLFK